jgi:glycine dehydrogenase subunit 1
MAMHATGRQGRVVTAASVHPEYRQILETYFADFDTKVVTVGTPNGAVDPNELAKLLTDDTACVLLQHPNFFGCLEDMDALVKAAHERGALVVVAVDPISLGLLKRPGEYGADIVVAEGQSLGTPLQYGGPYLGIMACREQFVRRMPGRIAGQTVDRRGKRCWVLTLQTREQHIRREKATSNICTNQGLFALRAAVYLAAMGPQGMREIATACLRKSRYALDKLTAGGRLESRFNRPTFKEFVVRDTGGRVNELLAEALDRGYFAGIPLGQWYPELDDCLLICVTERRTREEIDGLAEVMQGGRRKTEGGKKKSEVGGRRSEPRGQISEVA